MKLKQREDGEDNALQLLISHPNYSGLQIDQLTRHWIPSDYVSDINITLDGEPVMSFNGGISISENPAFTFHMDKDKKRHAQGRRERFHRPRIFQPMGHIIPIAGIPIHWT